MTFEYGDYLRECFSQPVLGLLWTLPFILLFFIPAVLGLWRQRTSPNRKAALPLVLIILALLLIIGVPLHRQLSTLVRTNGIAILQDRNAEQQTITGVIEALAIAESGAYTRFTYEGKHHYGVWLTIAGTQYYAVTAGELDIGSLVTLRYLPKSRCVLHLTTLENTTPED